MSDLIPPHHKLLLTHRTCSVGLVRHSTSNPNWPWGFIPSSRNQNNGKGGCKELTCPSDHWCWLQLPHPISQAQLCCLHCTHSRIWSASMAAVILGWCQVALDFCKWCYLTSCAQGWALANLGGLGLRFSKLSWLWYSLGMRRFAGSDVSADTQACLTWMQKFGNKPVRMSHHGQIKIRRKGINEEGRLAGQRNEQIIRQSHFTSSRVCASICNEH